MPSLTSIDPRAFVAAEARVDSDCTIQSGAHVCRGVNLGRGVQVGPNAVFVESLDLRSVPATTVENDVRIGANSTIHPGLVIGAKAFVRPGSVVTRSVPPGAIVEGNPASIVGYVDTIQDSIAPIRLSATQAPPIQPTAVSGVTLHLLPLIPDMRGALTVCEFERQVPFVPKRSFMVFDVPTREVRGEHAHHHCHQFLICARGSCSVVADDGKHRIEVVLDAPNLGVYLPPMTWGIQYKYSPDALLIVFASDYYDASDYIRSYPEFLRLAGA